MPSIEVSREALRVSGRLAPDREQDAINPEEPSQGRK